MNTHVCCFVLGTPPNTHQCGKPVGYKMVLDDGSLPKVRKYNPWCDEHIQWVKDHPDPEDPYQ